MALSKSQLARIRAAARKETQRGILRIRPAGAPRSIQQRYSALFYQLLKILNDELIKDSDLGAATRAFNSALQRQMPANSLAVELAFGAVVKRVLAGPMLERVANEMVNEIFPQLEAFNAATWDKNLRAKVGEGMSVNLLRQTREEASQRLAARMGENTGRITAWSREHYSNMQNRLNIAIRMSETTGRQINFEKIASRAIEAGDVPPNNRIKKRARLIARDQTQKFMNELSRGRAKRLGAEIFQWVPVGDDRTRPMHSYDGYGGKYFDMQGKEVDRETGERIASGADTGGEMPGDGVNCRCVAAYVFIQSGGYGL